MPKDNSNYDDPLAEERVDDFAERKKLPIGTGIAATIGSILQDPMADLSLDRGDVAFLVLTDHLMATEEEPSCTYDRLIEIYDMIERAKDPFGGRLPLPMPMGRMHRPINSLIDKRLLLRQADAPQRGQRRYKLGPLAREIARTYNFREDAERERLAAILQQIRLIVGGILAVVEKESHSWDDIQWQQQVCANLEFVVRTLLADIERRQLKLEVRHDAIRADIHTLLEREWKEAIAKCDEILQSATDASGDLKECFVSEEADTRELLGQLGALAHQGHAPSAAVVERIESDLNRLGLWVTEHFASWSRFQREVMQFVTNMVRLDPERVLSRTLAVQIRTFVEAAWTLPDGTQASPWAIRVSREHGMGRFRDMTPQPAARRVSARLEPPESV